MQQITIDRQCLLDFSTEYGRLPDMTIGNPFNAPGTHILIIAWLAAYLHGDDKVANELAVAFTGWLCGRGEFVLADECEQEFVTTLVALASEVVNVQGMKDDSQEA